MGRQVVLQYLLVCKLVFDLTSIRSPRFSFSSALPRRSRSGDFLSFYMMHASAVVSVRPSNNKLISKSAEPTPSASTAPKTTSYVSNATRDGTVYSHSTHSIQTSKKTKRMLLQIRIRIRIPSPALMRRKDLMRVGVNWKVPMASTQKMRMALDMILKFKVILL